jgi:Sigma-70 region 2
MSRPEEEFREFAGSRAASLHRSAYLLCGDWHLADDLVQETFVQAFRHWRRVQRADNQNAYVKRILINEFNRHWRRYGRLPVPARTGHPEVAVPDVSDEVVNRADLLRALLTLPARLRQPQVRAGVLRLVSVLPGITVTHGTADGQPTLTLTAGAAELGNAGTDTANPKAATGAAYQEAITINADTGIPLGFAGGPAGKTAVTVTYVVTRVNLADIAAGKF